ncbi:MAG: hypothetical protein AB7T27_02805 [Kiritimatiellia bacterium]
MKWLFVLIVWSLSFSGLATPVDAPVESADLIGSIFEDVSVVGSNLVLTFKSTGRRFKYTVNDGLPKVSQYGESLEIPIGATIRIADRVSTVEFSALPDEIKDYGFRVKMVEDNRTAGQGREEKFGFLIVEEQAQLQQRSPSKKSIRFISPSVTEAEAVRQRADLPPAN